MKMTYENKAHYKFVAAGLYFGIAGMIWGNVYDDSVWWNLELFLSSALTLSLLLWTKQALAGATTNIKPN